MKPLTILPLSILLFLPLVSQAEDSNDIPPEVLQVALDRQGFSVGCIDGHDGSKTQVALADFKKARVVTDNEDLKAKLEIVKTPAFRNYTITKEDLDQVGVAPLDWIAASKVKRMACESIAEYLGEKFHISEAYLKTINPEITAWNSSLTGKTVKVPNLNSKEKSLSASKVTVDCVQFRMRVFNSEGQIVASFPCSIARDGRTIPSGQLKITNAADNPTYTFDPKNYPDEPRAQQVGKRLLIPAGPNNPVGLFWIGLNRPSFGIHGTPHPETIGCRESHGCFRLTNWDILRLSRMIKSGVPLEVTGAEKATSVEPKQSSDSNRTGTSK